MIRMNRIVIIGAGQMGRTLAELININRNEILAFGDNDEGKWTDSSTKPPVVSVEKAVSMEPDTVFIGVLGEERTEALTRQIKELGYSGEIRPLLDIYNLFDIRSRSIRLLASQIIAAGVPGDVAELGVYKGDTAWQLNELFPDRRLYLFDTFEGFDERDVNTEKRLKVSGAQEKDFADTSVEAVMNRLPHENMATVRKGYFPETAQGLENLKFAFVSLDADLYEPTLAGLEYFYPRLEAGGAIVIHDYNNRRFAGVKLAVEEYEKKTGTLRKVPLADLHGSCVIVK